MSVTVKNALFSDKHFIFKTKQLFRQIGLQQKDLHQLRKAGILRLQVRIFTKGKSAQDSNAKLSSSCVNH